MRFSWIPREQKFFDMFDETTDIIVKAAQVFADLVDNFDHCDRRIRDLSALESQCDTHVEMILKALGRTFITPFDREDIHALATSLDDVLDDMEEAAYRLTAFRIDKPTPEALKMALIVQEACRHLQKAVQLCRGNLASEELAIQLREISRLENEADAVFRDAEADLFANPPADFATFIKWKEIYEWLESTVDRCRDVAHVINEIVVKGS